jgi:hypothetical protein
MLYGTAKYWHSWTGRPEDHDRDFIPELRVKNDTLFEPPTLLPLLLDGKAEVPCTCSILVRTEVVLAIGGFEESFHGMYEDQAFYAKVCLFVAILATSDCLAWYRQHSKSHSAVLIQSGELYSTQYAFLQWLERYCSDHKIKDANVLQTIRRKLWLNKVVSAGQLPALPARAMFRVKKWILWVEERALPSNLRKLLWMRR